MNCLDCDDLVQRLLDGDPAPDERDHLAACPACRDRLAAATLLLQALPRLPRPAPPPGFARRATAAVLRDRLTRHQGRRRAAGLAAAAVILLAAGLAQLWPRPTPPVPGPKTPPEVAVVPEKTPPLRPQIQEVRGDLARRFAETEVKPVQVMQTVSLPLDLAPMDTLQQLGPLEQSLGDSPLGFKHAARGAAVGLETVNASTRRAMTYFLRDLPPLSSPRTPTQ